MKRLVIVLFTLLLYSSAAALSVEKFDMTRDRLEVRHYRGGKRTLWVKRETGADFVCTAGFFGYKRFDGKRQMHGVDLTIENGIEKIGPHFPNRKILAAYRNGLVRVAANAQDCFAWGTPTWAVAGMTVPPEPKVAKWRQFWATKGKYFFRVKAYGTHKSCQRLAMKWGFEAMVHMDGGNSLVPGIMHPSYVAVFRDGLLASADN